MVILIERTIETDRLFPPFPWEHSECAWDIYVRCGISDKLMLLTVIAAESTISTADLVVRLSRYAVQLAESNSEERLAYGRITGAHTPSWGWC